MASPLRTMESSHNYVSLLRRAFLPSEGPQAQIKSRPWFHLGCSSQGGWPLSPLQPRGTTPSALHTLNWPNHKRILLPPSCSGTTLILLVVITIDTNIPHNSNGTNTTTGVPSTVCCVLTGFQQKAPASPVLTLPRPLTHPRIY